VLIGAGVAASLALAFDPVSGRRRRGLVRDKLTHAGKRLAHALPAAGRDFRHRARGVAAAARSLFDRERVSDDVLVERVRARLGRVVSHPHGIEVVARSGIVTLFGPVLRSEAHRLVRAVRHVHGVDLVEDRLQPRDDAGNDPLLQKAWGPVRHAHHGVPPAGRLLAGAAVAAAGAAWLFQRSRS
jgi:hypothetical protein